MALPLSQVKNFCKILVLTSNRHPLHRNRIMVENVFEMYRILASVAMKTFFKV